MRKIVLLAFVLVLLSTAMIGRFTKPVEASGTITIKADGSIDPPDALINTTDMGTYTFTDNIYDEIVVEKNNIVIDGADYILQGAGSGIGIDLSERSNVTIENIEIKTFNSGITLLFSSNNTVSGNNITNNNYGIWLAYSSNNSFFHNNFMSNSQQVYIETSGDANFWNDGYSYGGNYWSDYEEKYPDAEEIDESGIWNTPYVIDNLNKDNYPLMGMLSDFSVTHQEETYHVTTICNSTISKFQFDDVTKTISFNVTGSDYTLGFCRVTIPNIIVQELWQDNYTVLVDGEEPITMNNWTDGTYTYIYFTYLHSEHKVIIVPEFPTWTSMLLILIVLTVAIAIYKRRLPKTPIQKTSK